MVITLWFADLELLMIGKHNYKATLYRVLKIDEADARRVKGRGRAEAQLGGGVLRVAQKLNSTWLVKCDTAIDHERIIIIIIKREPTYAKWALIDRWDWIWLKWWQLGAAFFVKWEDWMQQVSIITTKVLKLLSNFVLRTILKVLAIRWSTQFTKSTSMSSLNLNTF